jgi:hypothetical protein
VAILIERSIKRQISQNWIYNSILEMLESLLLKWTNQYIIGGIIEDQKYMATIYIEDPLFNNISGFVDDSDFKTVPSELDRDERENFASFKFKYKEIYQ